MSSPQARSRPAVAVDRALLSVDHEIDAIAASLEMAGAFGVLVVDAAALRTVERPYGVAAYRQVIGRLADRIRESVGDRFAPEDRVLLGELGRDEILVLLFRPRKDVDFYRRELAALASALDQTLTAAGGRIGYPYRRTPLRFPIGSAFRVFDPTARPETQLRQVRDEALRKARVYEELRNGKRRDRYMAVLLGEEVTSVYEPITHLITDEVMGYEALVRGRPGSDLASPGQLFELAAETDTLFELDCLCRRSALHHARGLPPGCKLFLNILPTAIHDPAFQGDRLRQLLHAQNLQPSDVVFEISERESIGNFAIFREVCDHYSGLGFQIALDDMGAGYSSLEAVSELSPNYIKIDMSFVRGIHEDPARREIVSGLNSIAERIGAQIIAEGIETREELDIVCSLSVPFGQGHYLGRARSFESEDPDAAEDPHAKTRPDL